VDIYGMALLLGAAHGFFLALSVWLTRRGDPTAKHFLALLTLSFALGLTHELARAAGLTHYYANAYALVEALNFLYGPLAYFYVRTLTSQRSFRFGARQWAHFLPAIGIFALLQSAFLAIPEHLRPVALDGRGEPLAILLFLLAGAVATLASIVSIGVYVVLSIRLLYRHSRYIGQNFSYTEKVRLDWLRWLMLALTGLYLLYVGALFMSEWYGLEEAAGRVLNLSIVALIYTMGVLGMRQPLIFRRPRPIPATERVSAAAHHPIPPTTEDDTGAKYRKSAVSSEQSRAILDEIRTLLRREPLYRDNRLTLPQLSEWVGLSANYVSQAINEAGGVNFFDFVNGYRIEEARHLLTTPGERNPNILEIAHQCGFNSKTAFYAAFRKHTGTTPTQYRKQNHA
jgi:AraC-like DNA-binding protein